MASLPIERSDSVTDKNTLLMQHYNQPEYDSVNDFDANRQKREKFNQPKDNPIVTFFVIFIRKYSS